MNFTTQCNNHEIRSILAFGAQQQQQQQQPNTSLFGQAQNAQASSSLFGQPSTSTGLLDKNSQKRSLNR